MLRGFFIIILRFIYACGSGDRGQQSKIDTEVARNLSGDTPASAPKDPTENFSAFLTKISTDSVFQRSRINFPLRMRQLNPDDTDYQVSALGSASWFFMDFQQTHGLEREVTEEEDGKVSIRFYDPEVAFEVIYVFRSSLGKWYLEEIVDNSN